jgi:hypothetical protein
MKKVFLSVLISFVSLSIHAQSKVGTSFQNLISVSTIPPEAASLGKFGNIPVSYCTGIPSINIPIHEIAVGKIKLPISLDYHAGGIKVDEVASSVGLGWALNGPGVISRQMIGAPDESGGASFFRSPDPDSVWLSPQTYYAFLYGVRNGTQDAEPDIFQYSINGQSGKFIFRRDKTVMQTPVTNNKIVYTNTATFTITDEQGILYIFDKPMRTTLSGESGIGSYVSSWRLTKMVDANSRDTVYFSYEESCNASYELTKNYTHFLGPKSTCSEGGASWAFTSEPNVSYQTIGHYEAYPKEITWRGGKIVFTNTCDRIDVTGSAHRLSGVDVYSDQDGVLTKVKRITLHHAYFYSNGSGNAFYDVSEEKKRRLRLDSVSFLPVTGTDGPQVYRMTYDTATIMAPRESAAQDLWGLNNGQFDNSTMMPQQTHYYFGSYYTFGSAKRGSDEGYMKACTIKSIEYPTKGKTVFDFESHKYHTYQSETITRSVNCDAYGSVQQSNTTTFTAGSNGSGYRYSVFISRFNYPDVTDRPRVTLTDQTTGQQILFITTVPATATDQDYSTGVQALSLTAGHTYQLKTEIFTSNPYVKATAEISWTEVLPEVEVIKPGGGLRVKSITHYDIDGTMVSRELYDYGNGGIILTGQYYQNLNYEEVISRGASLSSCAYYYPSGGTPAYSVIYHANSVLPSSQCGGSPVLYSGVTKYQVDANGRPNGKTIYGYNIVQDETALAILPAVTPLHTFNTMGIYLASNSWKNGFLNAEQVYKYKDGIYTMIKSHYNDYRPYRETSMNVLKIKNLCINACCTFANQYPGYVSQDFSLTSVPQRTGIMLLRSSSDTTWDENNNKLFTVENYYYDDTIHNYPTRKVTVNSEGDTLSEVIKYPHDLAATGNVYQKMYDRNIVSPVVQHTRQKNGVQLSLAKINYNDWLGNSQLLLPQTVEEQVSNNPSEIRIRFNGYDSYGNILEQQKSNDQPLSYIWGYDALYPVASVTNALRGEIAYTSFESDISGNWTISSAVRDATQGITGSRSYSLGNGAISKTGLNTTKSFIVSYWSKSGSATVNGGTSPVIVGKNGWNYYEHRLPAGASSVTVSGSVIIDELRLYPADAQMSSFTYDPLVGMTSQCSANNLITYYEFDALGRLKIIRDMDRKILKVFEYYYKQ